MRRATGGDGVHSVPPGVPAGRSALHCTTQREQLLCVARASPAATSPATATPAPAFAGHEPGGREDARVAAALGRRAATALPRARARSRRRTAAPCSRAAGTRRSRTRGPDTPHSIAPSERPAPVSTGSQGSAPDSTPSMMVFISVACGRVFLRAELVGVAEQQHGCGDGPAGERRADQLAELLARRRRAHEPPGLQVLRDVAGLAGRWIATMVPTVSTPARAFASTQPAAPRTPTDAVPSSVTSAIPEVGCEAPRRRCRRSAPRPRRTARRRVRRRREHRRAASDPSRPRTRRAPAPVSTTIAMPPSTNDPAGRGQCDRCRRRAAPPPLTPRATAPKARRPSSAGRAAR